MLTASVIGTGPVAQAFVIAFRLPNLFRTLFAEGAFNTSFVPMFSRRIEAEGLQSARNMAEEVYAVIFAWLLLFAAAAQMAMPLLLHVIAPGYAADPDKFDLSVALTRIAFPQLLFLSLTAILGGMLNGLRQFAAAAAAPIVLNAAMIATLLAILAMGWGNSNASGHALVWSMSVAGVVQAVLLAIACRRAKIGLRLRRPRMTADVAELMKLAVPGLIAGGITQVNIFVTTTIASGIDRAVSYLYYAERLYQLPLGVIGVAIGVVLLPEMSRRLKAGDVTGALANQNRALEFAMFVTLPATVALTVSPLAVVATVFEHGSFSADDAHATAAALASFAAGLPAYTLYKVFSPGFFARADTKWPMRVALISVACNAAGSLTLPLILGHVGLALSTALAAWINTILLASILFYRGHYSPDERLKRRLPRIVLASLAMGAVLVASLALVSPIFEIRHAFWMRAGILCGLMTAGAAAYCLAAHFLGAMTWQEARNMMRGR
jgi:putative peptidoglycan lipid II flippase